MFISIFATFGFSCSDIVIITNQILAMGRPFSSLDGWSTTKTFRVHRKSQGMDDVQGRMKREEWDRSDHEDMI